MTDEDAKAAAPAPQRPAPKVVAKVAAAADQAAKTVTQPAAANPPKRGHVVEMPTAAPPRVAKPARFKLRHYAALISYLVAVVLPALIFTGYLYGVAADQYASRVAFSIRSSENAGPISFLGALSQTVTVGGTDAEIVYEFVRSQQMAEAAARALPLQEIYNRPEQDVLFRLGEDRSIEDVTDYWNWMTTVTFDGASGIVEFEARAFDPESARAIAGFVLEESTRIVNDISTQAREDAVAVARQVLGDAEERLRSIRRQIRVFRDVEQDVDPAETAGAAMELMAALRYQLAEAQVALDSYISLVGTDGPRVAALEQRIASLRERIAAERSRLGGGAGEADLDTPRLYSDLLGDYEELTLELEFAQNAYTSALASFEQAQVEARRQSRFLAPHIHPTLSVEPQYPERMLMALGAFILLTVAWSVLFLVAYNIRDRR